MGTHLGLQGRSDVPQSAAPSLLLGGNLLLGVVRRERESFQASMSILIVLELDTSWRSI